MGDATEGQGCDELSGSVAEDGVHQRAGLSQFAGQVNGFVASYAAGNS